MLPCFFLTLPQLSLSTNTVLGTRFLLFWSLRYDTFLLMERKDMKNQVK